MEQNQTKNNRWIIPLIAIIVVIIAIVLIKKPGNKNVAIEGDSVKIGMIAALSGEAAPYGETVRQGTELAVEQLNKKGGINGKPIEVIYEDGKCTGKDSASAAQKLVSVDKVKFIVGASCSGETIAIAPIVEAGKVLTVSPVSSNPAITPMGDYVFRNHPSDNTAGSMLADIIIKKTNKVVIISENTDYSQGIRKVFNQSYTKAGGELAIDESFNTGTTDFRSLVSKIKASGVNSVYVNGQTETPLIQIANQLRDQKVSVQLYTAYMTGDAVKKNATLLDGLIAVDLPNLGTQGNAAQFTKDFQAKFGKDPNFPYFAAAAYDVIHLFKDGISKYGYDSTKVKDYLYSIKSYDGAAGTYHFDSNGDVVGIALTVKQLKNGEFVSY